MQCVLLDYSSTITNYYPGHLSMNRDGSKTRRVRFDDLNMAQNIIFEMLKEKNRVK